MTKARIRKSRTTDPTLCYIDDGVWAYFTTLPLDEATGDDWDDAHYELNAGAPYAQDGAVPTRIAFDGDFDEPCDHGSWSVDQINAGRIPWLAAPYVMPPCVIYAGTSLSEFKRLIREAGGRIFVEEEK